MVGEAVALSAAGTRPLLMGAVAAAAFVESLLLAWSSLRWPLVHDAPLMHYAAWRIGEGAVPYRDLFDMNFPGTYLLHRLVLGLLGPSDLAWRLFDLGWLLLTCAIVYVLCRRFGQWAAALGAIFFAVYHLSAGAWNAGQRDYLIVLFLLAGVHGVASFLEKRGSLRPLALAGIALGLGMTLKPQAALFWLVLAMAAALGASGRGAAWWKPPAAVLGAGLLPPVAVGVWLWWIGGLPAFVEILTGYVLPLYSRLAAVPLLEALGGHAYGREVTGLLLGLAAFSVWRARAHGGLDARRALLVLGLAYGVVHYAVQGKGWEYHLYPLVGFACSLGASWADGALVHDRPAVLGAFVGGVVVLSALLGMKGAANLAPTWVAEKERRVAALARDLGARAEEDLRVQVFDTTEGGIHALFRLRRAQAARFLYDFHFFHDVETPRVRALRAELLEALRRDPPALLVVFERGWPRGGYERLRRFPELAAWVEEGYALEAERDGYRLYARRRDS